MDEIKTQEFDALREIGRLSNEGLIIFNVVDDEFVHFNNIARELLGVEADGPENVVASLIQNVVEEDRQYLKDQYDKIINDLVKTDFEFRLKKGNSTITVCCNAYVILNRKYLVISLRDITRTKEHENYLVEFGSKKNTLLDTLTHHINGAVVLMQHLAKEAERSIQKSDTDNVKTWLALLNDNSNDCLRMIRGLLEDEYSESPKIFAKRSRINIVEKIYDIFQNLRETNPLKIFSFETSAPAIYIHTDEFKLLQVINNYASNAVKFTAADGKVSFSIREGKDEVVICIADNGIGIPEKLKPFIFDRLSIAGRTGLAGEKSTGLGLSINKKLAEVLQGKIWFESEEGAGSSFYLALPFE